MLNLPSSENAARFRDYLKDVGYRSGEVQTVLGSTEGPSQQLRNLPLMMDLTREPTTLNVLTRLFTVGLPWQASDARAALPGWVLEFCVNSGMLRTEGDAIVPAVMVWPFENVLIASDRALTVEQGKDRDLVLMINPTTRLLYGSLVRRPSRSTLDLGTGCGVLALSATEHSDRVLGTDLNPRAVQFARFNARLNGLDSVEFREGDSFQPVEGETFDHIISNPPFYISPKHGLLFCESDMDLDGFCRRLVREGPRYLNEGGYFQMLFEWVQIKGQPWTERLAEWFEGLECDAWVLRGACHDPARYVLERLRPISPDDSSASFAKKFNEWVAYLRERDVEMVHTGGVIIRKHAAPNWVRVDDSPGGAPEPFGEQLLQRFAAQDFLAAHASDDKLLQATARIGPNVRLEQLMECSDGRWSPIKQQLRIAKTLPFNQKLKPSVADFLGRFDGTKNLGEIIHDFSQRVEENREFVQGECVKIIRDLIDRGFLIPGDGAGSKTSPPASVDGRPT